MNILDSLEQHSTEASLCPDCGREIELHGSGWWSHVGLPNGCWRVSLDGPDYADDES